MSATVTDRTAVLQQNRSPWHERVLRGLRTPGGAVFVLLLVLPGFGAAWLVALAFFPFIVALATNPPSERSASSTVAKGAISSGFCNSSCGLTQIDSTGVLIASGSP